MSDLNSLSTAVVEPSGGPAAGGRGAPVAAGRRRRQVLVLCYHALSDDWDAALSTTPAAFRSQLTALVERGWSGATFTEAVVDPPARRTLAVTFDDAFDSVRTRAAPILAELGLPATVFVPTNWPGRELMHWPEIGRWIGTRFEDELAPMSWDDLRSLSASGWEIGAHTCSHPRLPEIDDGRIRQELEESRTVCEREIGRPCRSIAYPFGAADDRVRAAAQRAGYDVAAGLSPGAWVARDRFDWPRVGVWHGESQWRFLMKVSTPVLRVRASPAVKVLDTFRRRVRGVR
jgi:peptidoglycan/xylan/chitin deacetylase (PgdA/CDA1 family)